MIKSAAQKFYQFFINSKAGLFLLNKKFFAKFSNASTYWEQRYRNNGNSGVGSYGKAAIYKASLINRFVKDNGINSVIEFGCGDGNQLKYYEFKSYLGYDVASSCIQTCRETFKNDPSKTFSLYEPSNFSTKINRAELVLSIDVIYHLVEEQVYQLYMQHLFEASEKYVIIYAWDVDSPQRQHVKHHNFSKWIAVNKKDWQLSKHITGEPGQGYCDFFIYEKVIT